jgi:hypothetical protein
MTWRNLNWRQLNAFSPLVCVVDANDSIVNNLFS